MAYNANMISFQVQNLRKALGMEINWRIGTKVGLYNRFKYLDKGKGY